MNAEEINFKRVLICVGLGAIAGIICAVGTSILRPIQYSITLPLLIYIVYNRVVLGFFIGFVKKLSIVDNENVNPIIRGAIFGAIFSVIMIIIPELASLNFLIAGIVFGALIDFIGSKLLAK